MKRLSFFALALCLLLSLLSSCAGQETAPATAPEAVPTGIVQLSDDEAITRYLEELHSGVYEADRLFAYDDLTQYFILGEYKGLTYPDDYYLKTDSTREELESYLVVTMLTNTVTDDDYTQLDRGTVQRYDVAHIVYEGVIDGVALDSAATGAEGADLIIGSGNYIPGFEEGLVGVSIGSTVTLDLAFSPYYGDDTVAGKAIRFTVTVEYVQRPALPELTAELVNSLFGTSFADMDSVYAALKDDMDATRSDQAKSLIADYLQEKVLENSTVLAYPEKEMEHYRAHFTASIQQYADAQQLSLEAYLTGQGYTMAEFEDMKEDYARGACETDLMVFSLAKKEGIGATDEQISSLITGLYENNEGFSSLAELIEYYKSVYGPFYFENCIISTAAMDLVRQAAVKE